MASADKSYPHTESHREKGDWNPFLMEEVSKLEK
jgi:hypothetical protein